MAYTKSFPYTLKYKGSSYVIDRVVSGPNTFTTIQKDGGAVITFNDLTDSTPAYIDMVENTAGTVGDPTASSTIDLDADFEALFIFREEESNWGKQALQNILHLLERVEYVRVISTVESQELFWFYS